MPSFWVLLDHDILEFEVAVHDAAIVQVGHSLKQMRNEGLSCSLIRKSIFLQVSVERERIQLQDNISGVLSFVYALKPADVGVAGVAEHPELLAEGGLAVVVVLREVDRPLEGLDGNFPPRCETDGVIYAGGHAFSDFFDGLEGGVETQLHDEFPAQNLAEHLQLRPLIGLHTQLHALFWVFVEDEADAVGLAQPVGHLPLWKELLDSSCAGSQTGARSRSGRQRAAGCGQWNAGSPSPRPTAAALRSAQPCQLKWMKHCSHPHTAYTRTRWSSAPAQPGFMHLVHY